MGYSAPTLASAPRLSNTYVCHIEIVCNGFERCDEILPLLFVKIIYYYFFIFGSVSGSGSLAPKYCRNTIYEKDV